MGAEAVDGDRDGADGGGHAAEWCDGTDRGAGHSPTSRLELVPPLMAPRDCRSREGKAGPESRSDRRQAMEKEKGLDSI